jgi:asparagine synthase (glutamine-hydrolysing)
MTALAGLWRFDGRPDAAEGCARMLASQELYGPHAAAQWTAGDVAIGRRLMRVLPEDAFDRQPLISGGGRYVLVADIRLDNRNELTDALQIPSPQVSSLCDAAVLLATIERWEESYIDRIVGDYAFALWDSMRRRLLLARDPLGQRPLHYHRGNKFFAFASMPKGLHTLPEVPYAPDEERIAESLVLMPATGTQSFFQGIERVEPGRVVTVAATGLSARSYWQPRRQTVVMRSPEEYSDALRELLDQAVRCRLRGAEDKVGADLSGGFDSGAVAASAARLLAPSGGRVVGFTAVPREGYDGPAPRYCVVDEGPYAAATAALYPNIEHVLIRSKDRSPLDGLDRVFFLFEQPCPSMSNAVWGNSINDAARERKLKVVLSGAAGNFGLSYNGMELLPELFRSGRWFRWWREARALVAPGQMRWRGVLANTLGAWCPAAVWVLLNRIAYGGDWDVTSYTAIHPRRFAELDLRARAREADLDFVYRPWKDGFAMRLWALRRGDPGNYNKGVLGGWHIDGRDPTADVRLLEFCLAIPTEQFLSNGIQRALARRALADRLPKLVLENPCRGLQAADWHERLTAVRDRVAIELDRIGACTAAAKVLDLPRLHRLVENWPAGGWERAEVGFSYRYTLLRGIATGHFLRRATGANR